LQEATQETSPPKPSIPNRDMRQRDIAAPEKLTSTTAYVVGVGAIGRQVALQLAAIGVGTLVLIDFDTVDPENLASQGFLESALGKLKVDALAALCVEVNHEIKVYRHATKFKRSLLAEHGRGVVFSCVDSMEARKFIWTSCKDTCKMFVDGRMAAEVCRVLGSRKAEDHAYYESTLFADSEAFQGTCTAKSTLYCANVAAGFMVAQLTKMYRKIPYDRDVQINILANEMHFEDHRGSPAPDDPAEAA